VITELPTAYLFSKALGCGPGGLPESTQMAPQSLPGAGVDRVVGKGRDFWRPYVLQDAAGGASGEVGEEVERFKRLTRDIYVLSFDTPALAKLKTSPQRSVVICVFSVYKITNTNANHDGQRAQTGETFWPKRAWCSRGVLFLRDCKM